MISVIIGGGEEEDKCLKRLRLELGLPYTLFADVPESFTDFCKNALRSTQILKIRKDMTDDYTERVANDDMIVFFPNAYLNELKIPFMYKLATIVETAIDMGLKIQAFSFVGEKDWNTHKLEWPSHWPTVSYFSTTT